MPKMSLKKQLTSVGALFLLFAVLVVCQIFYTHRMQQETVSKLIASHKLIGDYLALEESENALLDKLRRMAEREGPASEAECKTASDLNDDWFKRVQLWRQALEIWQNLVVIESNEQVLSPDFLAIKKRQADAYAKAIQLCKDGRNKEAGHLINIEKAFRISLHRSILTILEGIRQQIEADSADLRRFYAGSAIALLAALLALAALAIGVFRSLTKSLRSLEEGSTRIANGDFSATVPQVDSPSELARLSAAFNKMQTAVKTRDDKIREDNEEIRKLNESLERKVVERNKTIMQQNIALTRKNEELEQVLYAASHDLRTPLIGIQGFSEELKGACADLVDKLKAGAPSPDYVRKLIDEDIVVALKHIVNGSKRMEILLEGLLRISRMGRESLQIQETDMDELVKNVAAGFDYQIHEIGASIEISSLGTALVDPSQFEQVFTNLIGNAIKYRAPERKLSIKVSAERNDDFTTFRVDDNGIGIAQEHLDRVFHAFFRVDAEKVEGDGVGLAIVNRAIDLHNGRAWVESAIGSGSSFFIEIPNRNFIAVKQ